MRNMQSDTSGAARWLEEFEAAVRARDFETGRRMFARDAVAFGTWARALGGAGDTAWIAASWWSDATGPDGKALRREGRATFVLGRRDGRWVAVHSHVSLLPSQSESAHGRL